MHGSSSLNEYSASLHSKPKRSFSTYAMLASLLCTTPVAMQAQGWCPPGAEWEYLIEGFAYTGAGVDTYIGDTVITGRTAQRIAFYRTGHNYMNNTTDTTHGEWYTSYEDGVVYQYLLPSQEWDTLYWLSAAPGDRWYPPGIFVDTAECPPPMAMVHVMDTGTVDLNGSLLRYVDVIGLNPWGEPGPMLRIHERFGTYLMGVPIASCVMFDGAHRLCTYTDDLGTVYNSDYFACAGTSGIFDIATGRSIVPYPNPSAGHVRFSGVNASFTLELHDLSGRLVLTRYISDPSQGTDLTQVPAGVYVMRLRDHDGHSTLLRWVKE